MVTPLGSKNCVCVVTPHSVQHPVVTLRNTKCLRHSGPKNVCVVTPHSVQHPVVTLRSTKWLRHTCTKNVCVVAPHSIQHPVVMRTPSGYATRLQHLCVCLRRRPTAMVRNVCRCGDTDLYRLNRPGVRIYIYIYTYIYMYIFEYGHEAKPSILGVQIVFLAARRDYYDDDNYYGARQEL